MHFPYYPDRKGPNRDKTGRWEWSEDKYSESQNAVWNALNTAYYAVQEGRAKSLVPMPGARRDMGRFQRWKVRAIQGWERESKARDVNFTRGVVESDFPEHVWLWIYDRLEMAGAIQDSPETSTPPLQNVYDG